MLKSGTKKTTAVNEKDLWKITDTFAIANKKITSGNVSEKTVLFSFKIMKKQLQMIGCNTFEMQKIRMLLMRTSLSGTYEKLYFNSC